MTTPVLGQVVHAVSMGSRLGEFPAACHPAMITEILPPEPGTGDTIVSLAVFKPWALELRRDVHHDEGDPADDDTVGFYCAGREYPGGTWHPAP